MAKPTGEELRRLFQAARREAGGRVFHLHEPEGSEPGWPDIVDGPAVGLPSIIECKSIGEVVRDDQRWWLNLFLRLTPRVYVLRPANAISVAHALGLSQLAPVLADLGCGDAPAVPGERQRFDPATATDLEMAQELLRLGVPALTIGHFAECGQVVRRLNYMRLYHEALIEQVRAPS